MSVPEATEGCPAAFLESGGPYQGCHAADNFAVLSVLLINS